MIELKLPAEDAAALLDLSQHPGVRPLLIVAGALARDLEEAVIRYDLSSGDEKKLVVLKSQAEGARKLLHAITSHLERIRMGSSPPKAARSRPKQEAKNPR